MRQSYETKKPKQTEPPSPAKIPQEPTLDALRSGAVKPTREQMGHRVDLPDAMREKMENAFGADLSAVKLYESQAVEDAGANAVTQGSNIAFAPGMLDFTGTSGQALLGHEISHVVSQARGEVAGSGFLNDRALEARADREGAMAAAGQQVAVPAAAMSPVSAASASGPMQADKNAQREAQYRSAQSDVVSNIMGYQQEMRGRRNRVRLEAYKKAIRKASRQERRLGRKLPSDSTVDRNTGSMIFAALNSDPGIMDSDQLLHETDSAMSLWGGEMDDDLKTTVGSLASSRLAFHTNRYQSNKAYLSSQTGTYMQALTDFTNHASDTPQNTRFADTEGNPLTARQYLDDFKKREKEKKGSKSELAFLRELNAKHFSNDNV